jgi:hypothetical protein
MDENGAAAAAAAATTTKAAKRRRQPSLPLAADVRARLFTDCYRDDWTLASYSSTSSNIRPFRRHLATRIFAASINVLVASALPGVAFGVQLSAATQGALTPAHTLAATAIASVVQALAGGQPLLVVGVAEPIVILWAFLAAFCRQHQLDYLPFCAWACVWASAFLLSAALAGFCNRTVAWFSRFSGETFGTVIAVLFAAVGIKGIVDEFRFPPFPAGGERQQQQELLRLCNGLWAVIVAAGTAATALLLAGKARLWRFGWPWLRALLADYGALLAVVGWTGVSFAVRVTAASFSFPAATTTTIIIPHRVPRFSLEALFVRGAAATGMATTPNWAIGASLVPGLIIAVLFWFDHTVSSRLAHDAGGHPLNKPTAYDWDLAVCGALTLAFGLLGLPPTNGVIPQTPILARSLLLLLLPRRRRGGGSSSLRLSEDGRGGGEDGSDKGPSPHHHHHRLAVLESRWPNLVQGVLCAGLCLPLVPVALPLVPLSVVYGFFFYLAVEPLASMQLWRDQVFGCLCTDAKARRRRRSKEERRAPSSLSSFPPAAAPVAAVALLTAVQLSAAVGVALLALLAGVAGLVFPVPLALLVPLRRWGLPVVFGGGGSSPSSRRSAWFGGAAALEALDPLLALDDDGGAMLALEDEVAARASEEEMEEEGEEEGRRMGSG